MGMEKYRLLDALRVIFFRFFAAVGLAAILLVVMESPSEAPKFIEKAMLWVCFGGIF